jgi:hypothetical protein
MPIAKRAAIDRRFYSLPFYALIALAEGPRPHFENGHGGSIEQPFDTVDKAVRTHHRKT